MSVPRVSFVIPTFNEEGSIGAAIDAIRRSVRDRFPFEITVVDNGSADATVEIARRAGARVVIDAARTVAGLRNLGAAASPADIYVFLDGDVLLTDQWGQHAPGTLALLQQHPEIVTGSTCGISNSHSWIEEYWFKPLLTKQSAYINSGHLIVSWSLFHMLGGFDENLNTGEDYDFSQRARAAGARILNDPRLAVVHEGYPKTLAKFVRREVWHGQGDAQSLRGLLASKVALAALGFAGLHVALLGAILTGRGGLRVTVALVMAIVGLCLGASFTRYRRPLRAVLVNSYLYYWYFLARSLSPVYLVAGRGRGWRSTEA